MRRVIILALALVCLVASMFAQLPLPGNSPSSAATNAALYTTGTALPATCTAGRDLFLNTTYYTMYQCAAPNTWEQIGKVLFGAGSPASSSCDQAQELGRFYADTSATSSTTTLYVCAASGAGTYAWTLIGSGGPAAAPAGLDGDIQMKSGSLLAAAAAGVNYYSPKTCGYVKTSSTRLTLFPGASTTTPCVVGSAAYQITAPVTLDISGTSSTGSGFVWADKAGTVYFGHNTATTFTPSSGLTVAASTTAFPGQAARLFAPTWSANVWDDFAGTKDLRYPMARNHSHVCIGCTAESDGADDTYTFTVTNGDPNDLTTYSYQEDFLGFFSQSGWVLRQGSTPCSSTVTPVAAEANHPGIQRFSTNGTANSHCSVVLLNSNSNSVGMIPSLGSGGAFTSMNSLAIFRTTDADLTNTTIFAGFMSVAPTSLPGTLPAGFIGARVDTLNATSCGSINGGASGNIAAGKIFVETRSANVNNCIDTGLTYTANTWYKVSISSTSPGTINFAISTNGGAYGTTMTSSTNVPTVALIPGWVFFTPAAATKTLEVDRSSFIMRGLTR